VLGFGFRFLTKHAAARRAQEGQHQGVTTPADDYAAAANNGLAEKAGKDDFASFVSAVSDGGPLDLIISSVHAREATLARLRQDIGQCLGRVELEQQFPSRQEAGVL
jgi:hypothetical protein